MKNLITRFNNSTNIANERVLVLREKGLYNVSLLGFLAFGLVAGGIGNEILWKASNNCEIESLILAGMTVMNLWASKEALIGSLICDCKLQKEEHKIGTIMDILSVCPNLKKDKELKKTR